MPFRKLREFLNERAVKYVTISHSPTYTAQEIAASAHVPGKELAKSVVIKVDGEMAIAVLPAAFQVRFDRLKELVGTQSIELADESEFKNQFPGCELGAMPPFGNLFGMKTFVAATLTEDKVIAFNAGSHTELIRMSYHDFARLAQPTVLDFSSRAA